MFKYYLHHFIGNMHYAVWLLAISLFSSFSIAMESFTDHHNHFIDLKKFISSDISTNVGIIKDFKYNCNGDKIAVIGENCTSAQIWNVKTKELTCSLTGHIRPINCIAWHPTKDFIFTGSKDTTIKLWNAHSGKQLANFGLSLKYQENTSEITSLTFAMPYSLLFSGNASGIPLIKFFKFGKRPQLKLSTCLNNQDGAISHTSFHNAGKLACTASQNGILKLYKRPDKFNSKNKIQPWVCILECNLLTSDNVELIKFYNNNHIFIRLKNIETGYITCKVIKIEGGLSRAIDYSVADYCQQTQNYLSINNNTLSEGKFNPDNLISDDIFVSKSNIISATYNLYGNQIIVTTEEDLNILEKQNKEWIIIHYIPNSNHMIFNPGNNSIFASASLKDNIISIIEPSESDYSYTRDQDLLIIDKEQFEQGVEKRKRDLAEFDKSQRPTKLSKNQEQEDLTHVFDGESTSSTDSDLDDSSDSEFWDSNDDSLLNTNIAKEKEHEYDPAHEHLIPQTQLNLNTHQRYITEFQETNIPLENENQIRYQKEIAMLRNLHSLISFDRDIFKKTLIEVIANCSEDIIEKYVAQFNGNFNDQDNKGRTPLYAATDLNKESAVKLLAKKGSDVNTSDYQGISPLHVAINKSYLPIVQCLLAHNALVNSKTSTGITPLHIAVNNKDVPLVRLLLEANANMFAEDNQSTKPIDLVIADKDADLIELFVEKIKKE